MKLTNGKLVEDTEFERKWFEIDRGVVIGQLSTLRRSIINGAKQMEMIAAEKMFEKPLSDAILSKARSLQQLARSLKEIALRVASASSYPAVKIDERKSSRSL